MANLLDHLKALMERFAPQKVKDFLHKPLGYGTALGILFIVAVMTVLFWKAHSLDEFEYANNSLLLADMKFYDAKLEAELDEAQNLGVLDTLGYQVPASVLVEIGAAFNGNLVDRQIQGSWVPDSLSGELQRQLIVKIMRTRFVLEERARLASQVKMAFNLYLDSLGNGKKGFAPVVGTLSLMLQGNDVDPLLVPVAVRDLVSNNHRQVVALKSLQTGSLREIADAIIALNQQKITESARNREIVNISFYFLSILILLAVLVLLVRVRR